MSKTLRIRFWTGVAVLSVALALLAASLLANQSHPDTESTARDLGRRVEKRLALLDDYARQALEADPEAWLRLECTGTGRIPSSPGPISSRSAMTTSVPGPSSNGWEMAGATRLHRFPRFHRP